MNLFLLRHGLAVERDEFDFVRDELRPLTAKGKNQMRQVSAAMRVMELKFDLIFCSPLVRARQTAEIVAADLKLKQRLSLANELKPGGKANKLIQTIVRLKPVPENVLMVGHEPDLSALISRLVTGQAGAGFVLKKGGLAKLEIENLNFEKCARLAWLITPAQMKLVR